MADKILGVTFRELYPKRDYDVRVGVLAASARYFVRGAIGEPTGLEVLVCFLRDASAKGRHKEYGIAVLIVYKSVPLAQSDNCGALDDYPEYGPNSSHRFQRTRGL